VSEGDAKRGMLTTTLDRMSSHIRATVTEMFGVPPGSNPFLICWSRVPSRSWLCGADVTSTVPLLAGVDVCHHWYVTPGDR
jgi:hypothetical protein